MKVALHCNSTDALDQARFLVAMIEELPRKAAAHEVQPTLCEIIIRLGEDLSGPQAAAILARVRELKTK